MDKEYPGWQKVIIDPQIPKGITRANTTKETPYGTVVSKWEIENSLFSMELKIPVGVTAKVVIPNGIQKYNLNGKEYRVTPYRNFFELVSGKYELKY
jgi:alpha-L-rhamnosidase